ncbi:hypothetical protein CEY16_06565 [Halalkalibacillus sediminis]|uniref:Uncharacterized protein n=1 Tax=Halalkalibacillus sediminis TaxID=2018042 RepID=A0A2I0QTC9_9BACI|nr:ABC transporter permease [Halalkalibacillus sediminis]PKR77597.1 hypothetical protein CEY16_06565 [Halalkalibacillus sediminis]
MINLHNGKHLFKHRLKVHRKEKLQLFKVSVDWTVWLYFLIPILAIAIYRYITLWQGTFAWGYFFNEQTIVLPLILFVTSGFWFTHIKAADMLFLWQKGSWINELKLAGLLHMIKVSFFRMIIFFIGFLPIFLNYMGWHLVEIAFLFFLLLLMNIPFQIIKRDLSLRLHKWIYRFVIVWVAAPVALFLFFTISSLGQVGAMFFAIGTASIFSFIYIKLAVNRPFRFEKEVELETTHQSQLGQMVLGQSALIGGPEYLSKSRFSFSRKRPLLFRKSGRVYRRVSPENGWKELYIKSLLRDSQRTLVYLQLVVIGCVGLWFLPFWFKLLLWVILIGALGSILRDFWFKVGSHGFLDLVSWPTFQIKRAVSRALLVAMAPGVVIMSAVVGWSTFTWLGLTGFVVGGFVVTWLMISMFVSQVIFSKSYQRFM